MIMNAVTNENKIFLSTVTATVAKTTADGD